MTKIKKYLLAFMGFSLLFTYKQQEFIYHRRQIQTSITEMREESESFRQKYDEIKSKKSDFYVMPVNLRWLIELVPQPVVKYLPSILKHEEKAVTRFEENELNLPRIPVGWDIEVRLDMRKIDNKELKTAIAHEIYHVWEVLDSEDIKGYLDSKSSENSLPYEKRPSETAAEAFASKVQSEIASKKAYNGDSEASEEPIEVDQ